MSAVSAAMSALALNSRSQAPEDLSAILKCAPSTTACNEAILIQLGKSDRTPDTRKIARTFEPLPGYGLSFACKNSDKAESLNYLPTALDNTSALVDLKSIKLPASLGGLSLHDHLRCKLGGSAFSGTIQAHVTSLCMLAPISASNDKSTFVPIFEAKKGEYWSFYCFNRGGDVHSDVTRIEFNNETRCQLQSGPLRNGSDWSIAALPAQDLKELRRQNPALASECEKSNIVIVGVRLKPTPPAPTPPPTPASQKHEVSYCYYMASYPRVIEESTSRRVITEEFDLFEEAGDEQPVPTTEEHALLLDWVREDVAPKAGTGIFMQGPNRPVKYDPPTYNGPLEVDPENVFVCFAAGLPIDFSYPMNENNVKDYLQSCREGVDSAVTRMKSLVD